MVPESIQSLEPTGDSHQSPLLNGMIHLPNVGSCMRVATATIWALPTLVMRGGDAHEKVLANRMQRFLMLIVNDTKRLPLMRRRPFA